MTKKKKIIILSIMVGLLVITGYINVMLNNSLSSNSSKTNTSQPTSTISESFYVTYKTERESTRKQEIQFYEAIITSATSSQDAKQEAEKNKLNLINQMEKELVIEGILVGKGFDDAIITQSETNVNVFIKSPEIDRNQMIIITDVVCEQLGVPEEDIIIIPSE